MHIQLIRNATLKIKYAAKTFLVDPFLADQGAYPPFANSARQDQPNPLHELPVPAADILQGVDAVIVTHLHLDHYDEAARQMIPKHLPLYCQNDEDGQKLREDGFENVVVLTAASSFENISLIKTKGEHGRGPILQRIGLVCGVVFKHTDEKTLYVAGDTVWNESVQQEIEAHHPEVIVLNAGDNQFLQGGSLVMGKEDVHYTHRAAPGAQLIAVHMEAVNHWTLSRQALSDFAEDNGFRPVLHIPEDGETLSFP